MIYNIRRYVYEFCLFSYSCRWRGYKNEIVKTKGNGTGAWTNENWAASSIIQDKLYQEDDELAEAEYETQTAIIQSQDKMLDVELKQIETQQKACENEIESVKKILDKNVEKACKYMS